MINQDCYYLFVVNKCNIFYSYYFSQVTASFAFYYFFAFNGANCWRGLGGGDKIGHFNFFILPTNQRAIGTKATLMFKKQSPLV